MHCVGAFLDHIITGTDGPNELVGVDGADQLSGLGGDDVLIGVFFGFVDPGADTADGGPWNGSVRRGDEDQLRDRFPHCTCSILALDGRGGGEKPQANSWAIRASSVRPPRVDLCLPELLRSGELRHHDECGRRNLDRSRQYSSRRSSSHRSPAGRRPTAYARISPWTRRRGHLV